MERSGLYLDNNKIYGNKYDKRKILYIVLLIFIIINYIFVPSNNQTKIVPNTSSKSESQSPIQQETKDNKVINSNSSNKEKEVKVIPSNKEEKKLDKKENEIKPKNKDDISDNIKSKKEEKKEVNRNEDLTKKEQKPAEPVKNKKEIISIIDNSRRTFFEKFELICLISFLGVLYYLMWYNSNKSQAETDEEIKILNDNEKLKNIQDEISFSKHSYYPLLNDDNEYYEL
jgi:hypothetical protein